VTTTKLLVETKQHVEPGGEGGMTVVEVTTNMTQGGDRNFLSKEKTLQADPNSILDILVTN
jgi:hypothetical protein